MRYLGCCGESGQQVLYQVDQGAGLQVPRGLPQDGDEHGPDLRLQHTVLSDVLPNLPLSINSQSSEIIIRESKQRSRAS